MLVLVVYDIPDNKRRLKLSNFLEGHGRRVQNSVFECFLTLDEMKKLHHRILRMVNAQEDNIRFYWVPADSLPRTLTIGSAPPEPPPKCYII